MQQSTLLFDARSGRTWSTGRRWTTALALVLAGAGLLAPGTGVRAEQVSLSSAVEIALANHPLVLETAALAEAALAARREAGRSRLPQVELSEVAMRTDSPADVFGLELMQERFSFPAFTAANPNDPSPIEDFATQFEASVPLFTGGRITAGIRQADHASRAAASMAAHIRSSVALGVLQAYLDRLLAMRFVELAEKAHDTTRKHVGQAEDLFDNGMIVESDLLRARVQLARMEENRIRARHRLELSRAGLNRAMGLPLDSAFELVEEVDSASTPQPPPLAEAIVGARERRTDLAAAHAAAEAAAFGVRREIGGYLPELALRGLWSFHGTRLTDFDARSTAVMGILRWRLFDGGQTSARITQARRHRDAAEQRVRSLEHQIEMEVRQAWQAVDEARARLAVTHEARVAAERALAILEDRFAQGVARTTDLLDAETEAHEARVRDTEARYDLKRALGTLRFATGEAHPEAGS